MGNNIFHGKRRVNWTEEWDQDFVDTEMSPIHFYSAKKAGECFLLGMFMISWIASIKEGNKDSKFSWERK